MAIGDSSRRDLDTAGTGLATGKSEKCWKAWLQGSLAAGELLDGKPGNWKVLEAIKSGYVYKYAIGSGGSENFATGLNLYYEQGSENRALLEVPALGVKESQFVFF